LDEIRNLASGKCLSGYYNSLDKGTGLVQYDCHGWPDQEWQVLPQISGGLSISLQSRSSGYYVNIPGGSPLAGTQLIQWPTSSNEVFTLTPR
jgi:hypothetical protein